VLFALKELKPSCGSPSNGSSTHIEHSQLHFWIPDPWRRER